MVLINGVLEKNLLKKIDNMALNNNEYRFNLMRQMIENDRDCQRKKRIKRDQELINDYRDGNIPSNPSSTNTSYTSKFRDPDLKISVLTDENKALKQKYGVLLQKTNQIVEVYRKQETDIKNIKIRLEKREKHTENVAILKKYLKDVYNNIIAWFNS